MKRNRRDSIRKERIIMVTSSAFVLAALTMTGLYMKGQEAKQQDDGYTLDFTALDNGINSRTQDIDTEQANNTQNGKTVQNEMDSDLDYMPLEDGRLSAEAGSHLIQIPGLTDNSVSNAPKKTEDSDSDSKKDNKQAEENKADEEKEKQEENTKRAELHYNEEQGLHRPVSGEVLMPYSMDGSIYFATLDQYKYNPATMFAADEGADVYACAEGRVANVYDDSELGHVVTLELGDGYVATYGQLSDIKVEKDGYVKAGDKLGTVAAPSKYYSMEGVNLYFRLEKDGTPVNAENLFL